MLNTCITLLFYVHSRTGDTYPHYAMRHIRREKHSKSTNSNNANFISKNAVVQAKLNMTQSGEKSEIEADKTADKVLSNSSIQNDGVPLTQVNATAVQSKEVTSKSSSINSGNFESRLKSNMGKGDKMSSDTKSEMESGFGTDFSSVNIHTGKEAQDMSEEIGAKAFTYGNDIYFNSGEYDPNSFKGKHLLAHELTHTIQQKGMVQKKVQKAEADTRVGTKNLKDSKSQLNKFVNDTIAAGRKLGSIQDMFEYIYNKLAANTTPGRSAIENWVTNSLPSSHYYQPPVADTKYKDVPGAVSLFGEGKIWLNPVFDILNPSIKVGGILMGSDKLGHFFQQGFDYYRIAIVEKQGQNAATDEGKRTEREGYGMDTTGIYSNADLTANLSGFSFWKDLLSNPQGYSFDISNYATQDWNEEFNPNFYAKNVGKKVWQNLINGISKGYISYPDLNSNKVKGSASGSLNDDQFTGSMSYQVPDKNGTYSIDFDGTLSYNYDQALKAQGRDAIKGVTIEATWKHNNGSTGTVILTSYKEKILQGTLMKNSANGPIPYRKFKFYT